ncbi:hypothetical protein [Haladaptatus pallidirubidus]|uniref:hypothetical protein n=1 Tax=Haladaptatus pallidirubidus TaxID=1008152 RepID=UPI00406BB5E8
MGVPATIEFDDAIQQRIYDEVERNGSVSVEELRDQVRIDSPTGSKPARSGTTEPQVRIPPEEFRKYVSALLDAGHLTEEEGELHLALDNDVEEYEDEGFRTESDKPTSSTAAVSKPRFVKSPTKGRRFPLSESRRTSTTKVPCFATTTGARECSTSQPSPTARTKAKSWDGFTLTPRNSTNCATPPN